jgi:hypothetical protein
MGYYSHPAIKTRMAEFLSTQPASGKASCIFLITADGHPLEYNLQCKLTDFPSCLDDNLELARSLWDRDSLLVDLDIEYVNFDFPAEPYLDPERTFSLQEPLELAIKTLLPGYGITPLHLLSGRGHHFIWRICQNSSAFKKLGVFGHVNPSLAQRYCRELSPTEDKIEPPLAAAFAGLGQVIEFFAHRVRRAAAPVCRLPIALSAIEVGPGERGREMIFLDLSQYGDPLYARVTRVPFSRYLKPKQQRVLLGESIVAKLPPVFEIPLYEMGVHEALEVMHNPDLATALATRASVAIPDCSNGMSSLIDAYLSSREARFHEQYYSEEPNPPDSWPESYDRIAMDPVTPCARFILEHPNDLLLRPACVRRVVCVLLALGWHPRHIAGLIQSKFERDYGWGDLWEMYDPSTRADFYTRLFVGEIVDGCNTLIDLNCKSA